MRRCSYNFGLISLVMFGNFAKLDSPRRLVQFWQNYQTSLVLLIPNCTHNRMITYTKRPPPDQSEILVQKAQKAKSK